MKTDAQNNTLVLPSALLAEVEAAADAEHRSVADLLRDLVEHGLKDRRWQRTLAYGQERARTLGLTEEDVPRLIAELRREAAGESGQLSAKLTVADAVARIRELRKGNILPEEMTIRSLIEEGRA